MIAKFEQDLKGVQKQPPEVFYKKAIIKKYSQKNACVGVTLLKKENTYFEESANSCFQQLLTVLVGFQTHDLIPRKSKETIQNLGASV